MFANKAIKSDQNDKTDCKIKKNIRISNLFFAILIHKNENGFDAARKQIK